MELSGVTIRCGYLVSAHEKMSVSIVTEATTLAKSIFTVPLNELASVLKKIDALADAENQLLSNALGALRADGLPDLKPILTRFIQEVRPDAILDALPGARAHVFQAVHKITWQVSRRVQR